VFFKLASTPDSLHAVTSSSAIPSVSLGNHTVLCGREAAGCANP
jgi:hypothetical protein